MLRWALMCFAISLVEGALGLSGPASGSEPIAKLFFVLAVSLMVMFHRTQGHVQSNDRQKDLNSSPGATSSQITSRST